MGNQTKSIVPLDALYTRRAPYITHIRHNSCLHLYSFFSSGGAGSSSSTSLSVG